MSKRARAEDDVILADDSAPDTDVGQALARASLTILGAGALVAVVAVAVAGFAPAISVAIGTLIAASDTWLLGRIVRSLMSNEPGTNRGLWGLLGLTKLFVLFGGVWWLLSTGLVSGLAFAAGIASLPFGLVIFTLLPPLAPARKKSSPS